MDRSYHRNRPRLRFFPPDHPIFLSQSNGCNHRLDDSDPEAQERRWQRFSEWRDCAVRSVGENTFELVRRLIHRETTCGQIARLTGLPRIRVWREWKRAEAKILRALKQLA